MTRFNVTPQKTFLLRSAMSRFFISFFNSWDISHIFFGIALLKKVSLFVGFKRYLLTHYQQWNSLIFRVNDVTHQRLKCLNEVCLWESQWLRFISRFNVELSLLLSQERQIPNVIVLSTEKFNRELKSRGTVWKFCSWSSQVVRNFRESLSFEDSFEFPFSRTIHSKYVFSFIPISVKSVFTPPQPPLNIFIVIFSSEEFPLLNLGE